MALTLYKKKRNFKETSEPSGKSKKSVQPPPKKLHKIRITLPSALHRTSDRARPPPSRPPTPKATRPGGHGTTPTLEPAHGNDLSEADQWIKLARLVDIVEEVWGRV